MSELKKLIYEEIINLNFEYILNNFNQIREEYPNEYQSSGLQLLREYSLDLSNVYESTFVFNTALKGYEFYSADSKRQLTTLQPSGVIKIGPAATNDKNNLTINTAKQNKKFDKKLLPTHLSNIFKLIDKFKLKSISFEPADDNFSEARKRLFSGIVSHYRNDIEDIKTKDNWTFIKLK